MSKHVLFFLITIILPLSTVIYQCREKHTLRMHILLEVDMIDLLNSLAKNKDETFEKTLKMVAEERRQKDVDLAFILAKKLEDMDRDLIRYFGDRSLRNNEEILFFLHKQSDQAVDLSIKVLRNRIYYFGIRSSSIQKQGNNRIFLKLAGITDPQRVKKILCQKALFEFRLLKDQDTTQNVASKINDFIQGKITETESLDADKPEDNSVVRPEDLFGLLEDTDPDTTAEDTHAFEREKLFKENLFFAYPGDPQRLLVAIENEIRLKKILEDPAIRNIIETEGGDAEFMWGKLDPDGRYFGIYLLDEEPVMTGETISDAFPQPGSGYDPGSFGKFEVSLTFNDQGARIFSRVTGANLNKRLAIVLDRKVHSAPTIQAKIRDGRARITGLQTIEEAQNLAIALKSGALPYGLDIIEEKILNPQD